ncbi:MAG TPA: trimethylamine methyltransferase [Myxococcales bacterium]|nr:trimethylamine methyltransferase [Myxococcales bacterium]
MTEQDPVGRLDQGPGFILVIVLALRPTLGNWPPIPALVLLGREENFSVKTSREGRRRGGRTARKAARAEASAAVLPYLTRAMAPLEILSDDGLSQIESNAETILEEVGIDFRGFPSALDRLAAAGAQIDGERVRFARGLCREIVSTKAPGSFTQHARNPARNLQIGGTACVFAPGYGSPFVHDIEAGRRYASFEDFCNFVKLAHVSPAMHSSGGTVCEPVDIPVSHRHLDMVYAHLRYSDKAFMGSVTSPERAEDSVAMAKVIMGDAFVENHCVLLNLINPSSPMAWDVSMLSVAEAYAEHGQATMISPFILSGAMAPVTVAGVAAQSLAEALAGMAFVQLVRPGAPMVLGSFASSMSMRSGAPTFGTPEAAQTLFVMAALTRRLGLPFRSGGSLCASKLPDAQAGAESASTLLPTLMAGTNFVLHAAGWLEGGLTMGYEKFIIDADQCALWGRLLAGVDLSEKGQAMDAIREVGPGQHFLGAAHTLANFETAFGQSEVSHNDSFEKWQEEGSLDAARRAQTLWREKLAGYEVPDIDASAHEELCAFVARRREEIPESAE